MQAHPQPEAVCRLGPRTSRREAARDDDADLPAIAVYYLGLFGDPAFRAEIERALSDDDPQSSNARATRSLDSDGEHRSWAHRTTDAAWVSRG